ncbi:PREDICTED: patatin-like protein 2 [Nelumbo nucifera]|uniref:Patatin n=1 Tax=Nelumbo nucifera TaxID=4432 RepID=A0A1U8Q9E1_NELNU|nr:PREDICTED: patatin-like protein 2 [Nelumbo nucifera]
MILSNPRTAGIDRIVKLCRVLSGPKYDGKYIRSLTEGLLGKTTLSQTLTNVIIPTFDVKLLQPTIFTTKEAKTNALKNSRLSDICISTSAAPTYLPAHHFETNDSKGNTRSFNLIDGGVAANNPTLLALTHISKDILINDPDFLHIKPMDASKFLVLSLGTGAANHEEKYSAEIASNWGLLEWTYNDGATPLIDAFMHSSSDVVDIHASTLFQVLHAQKNYLRIQDDTLTGAASSVDIATEENLQNLVRIGKELLKKPMSMVNLETGKFEQLHGEGTNEEALIRFARLLSQQRRLKQVEAES